MRCPAYSLPTGRLRHLPTAANRFVKAQATMFHFPQAENSSCSLAFPLPAKQALRGPIIASAPGGAPIAPRCQSVTDTSRHRQYVACARMGAALLLEAFYFGVLPASNFRLSRCFSNASINRRGRVSRPAGGETPPLQILSNSSINRNLPRTVASCNMGSFRV